MVEVICNDLKTIARMMGLTTEQAAAVLAAIGSNDNVERKAE